MSKNEPAGRLPLGHLKFQEFDMEIGYLVGKQNQNADTLSRIPLTFVFAVAFKQENSNWANEQMQD